MWRKSSASLGGARDKNIKSRDYDTEKKLTTGSFVPKPFAQCYSYLFYYKSKVSSHWYSFIVILETIFP